MAFPTVTPNPLTGFLTDGSFTGAGFGHITGGGYGGANAFTRANVDGTLARPLLAPSFDPTIHLINSKIAQFLMLTSQKPFKKLRLEGAPDTYEWTEDRLPPEVTEATGSTAVQGTAIGVNNIDMFLPGDTVSVPAAGDAYGEVLTTVAGVSPAGTLNVAWFAGHAPTVAITAGMAIENLGNTQPEIGIPVNSPFTDKVQKDCHFQEMWFQIAESKRIQSSKFQIGGDLLAYELDKLRTTAEIKLEKTDWFGQASWNGTTGVGTQEGVYYTTGAARWNFGGVALTEPRMLDIIDGLTTQRPGLEGEIILAMPTRLRRVINTFPNTAVRTTVEADRWGVRLESYRGTDADVKFMTSSIFNMMNYTRDDILVAIRMNPDCIAQVSSDYLPELTFQQGVVPNRGSWDEMGYAIRKSLMVKDAIGNVAIAYDIG